MLTLLAGRAIDPRELTGVQQAWRYGADAAHPAPPPAPEPFVVRGAYGLVRHPIYLGWFLMVWSTPLMTSGRLTFAAISSFYLLIASIFMSLVLNDEVGSVFSAKTWENRELFKMSVFALIATIAMTELGLFQRILDTAPLTVEQWVICLGVSLLAPVVMEVAKFVRRLSASSSTPAAAPGSTPLPAATPSS